jgi:hypothetical protein
MDEPKSGARDGGAVSAPVFKEIAQQLLENANVARDLTTNDSQTVAQDVPEVADSDEPNLKGPPDADKTDRKADDAQSGKKTDKPAKSEQTKPAETDKTANVNKIVKPPTNAPAIWKTKPKT